MFIIKNIYSYLIFCIFSVVLTGCIDQQEDINQGTGNNFGECLSKHQQFDSNIFFQKGIHLYLIGDTGTGDSNQRFSAQLLEDYHISYPLDAIIHSGDVFYEKGLISKEDPKINDSFIDIYQTLKIKNLPWYFALGNHDHEGSIEVFKLFTEKFDNLIFSDNYSIEKLNTKDLDWGVNLIITDTTSYYDNSEQEEWLEKTILAETNQINIVVGHHPILSNGFHGSSKHLSKNFTQLFEQNNTPLYLTGHEHNLEIAQNSTSSLVHAISGGGGRYLRDINCGESSLFTAKNHGGIGIYITKSQIFLIPVTENGYKYMYTINL